MTFIGDNALRRDDAVTSEGAAADISRPRGTFITFEGGEGGGKSTHIHFLTVALKASGKTVQTLREPGGTVVGEALRALVLDPAHSEISARTELFIYEAARAQLVAEVIAPALNAGQVVLCDRFADSTRAYQGAGRGLAASFIDTANAFATDDIVPDRTLVLTCGAGLDGLSRATNDSDPDRLERENERFHDRVNAAFLHIAEEDPDRVRLIDSTQPKALTAYDVFEAVADLFGWTLPARAEVERLVATASPIKKIAPDQFTERFSQALAVNPAQIPAAAFALMDAFSFHG